DNDLPKLVLSRVADTATPSRVPCPNTIVQRNIVTGGLSLDRRRVNLRNLYYLDASQEEPFDPKWIAGPDLEIETTTIEISSGGVGARLVCHEGRWLYVNLD